MTPEGVRALPSSSDEIEKLLVRYRKHLIDAGIIRGTAATSMPA